MPGVIEIMKRWEFSSAWLGVNSGGHHLGEHLGNSWENRKQAALWATIPIHWSTTWRN